MFKKVIGKVCINPDCPQKDKVREESTVLCDCGQELQDQTITDKRKVAIFSLILVLLFSVGGYLGVMKLKNNIKDKVIDTGLSAVGNLGGETKAISPKPAEPVSPPIVTQADQKAAMTLVSEGLKLIKENRLQEAADKFRTATEKDPNNDQAFGNLGAAYSALGKQDEALDASMKAISLNTPNPIWHLNAAELYSKKGDKNKALDELEAAFNNGFNEVDKIKRFNFKNIENENRFKEIVRKK